MITRWAASRNARAPQAARTLSRFNNSQRQWRGTTARAYSLATATPSTQPDISPFFDRSSTNSYRNVLSFSPSAGLFGQPELASPQSFAELAARTVNRAKLLVERIHKAPSSQSELVKVVKNFDRLSDMLCGVIDAAELIRHSHPDKHWVNAANEVYESLCSYMNVLNTDVALYKVIKGVLANHHISSNWTYEQRQTALIFIRDFEKSGIHLNDSTRSSFVVLSDDLNVLGASFSEPSRRTSTYVASSDLDGTPKWVRERISRRSFFTGRLKVPAGSWEAAMISRYSPNDDLRQRLYASEVAPDKDKIAALEGMLKARDKLARILGKTSFAEWSLEDKMAKGSDHVMHFLRTLEAHERPRALAEVRQIAEAKQTHLGLASPPEVHPWDKDFYAARLQPIDEGPHNYDILFSAGSAFQALSRLFSHLYGLQLQPREVVAGEVWHPDVQRLDVVDERGSMVGIIYVDLWMRKGKHSGAAHYTVRCSRRIDDDDAGFDFAASPLGDELRQSGRAEIMQPREPILRTDHKTFQLPIAALVCEFVPPGKSALATGLTWHEVKTLFHEMGHAIHSMLGRTEYHNVSGTRCSTDFVELPSILMEKFLASPAVLSLFPSTPEAPIPAYSDLVRHLRQTNPFPAMESHTQIVMAILDQLYHSQLPSSPDFSSTAELHRLQNAIGLFPAVSDTAWQTQFTHLHGYGATYYTYLFCRAIAKKTWKTLFEKDPLNREAGERFKEEVLKFGGGKDPWVMVGSLLNSPEVAAGDRRAMEMVGQWGLEV